MNFYFLALRVSRKGPGGVGLDVGGALGNWMWRVSKGGEKPLIDLMHSSSGSVSVEKW